MVRRSKKTKFGGQNMHIEFHTTNPKKNKQADCIYLDKNRECQNKESPDYLSKCFAASYCTFKVKAKDVTPPPQPIVPPAPKQEEPKIKKIKCTLPLKCRVYSNTYGQGEYTNYTADSRTIEITFDGMPRKFIYPDAIFNKHLILPKFAYKIVLKDVSKAEKG